MIYIAIIDNEKEILKKIEKTIMQIINKNVKIYFFTSANSFLTELEKTKFQIVISDISMPEMNGIEMIKKAKEINSEMYIIFLTAYVEYAIESYRMEAYQYILKEELSNRLPEVLDKLIKSINKRKIRYCYIGSESQKIKICYDEIVSIRKEKGAKYVSVLTTEGICRERSSIEKMLMCLNGEEFVMVERGCAINLRHVKKIKGNFIYLNTSEVVEVSHARIKEVKMKLREYWREI
jgi:DNA-binding LytR/AlgR family response regulator